MKAPKRRRCVRQCSLRLLNRLFSTHSRCRRAIEQYQRAWRECQDVSEAYYGIPFREHPPDKKDASSWSGDAPKPEITKEQPDPTEALLAAQVIQRHTEGMPFADAELKAFGLSIFIQAVMDCRDRGEDFLEVVVGDSQLPIPVAFIKGAIAAAVALRSSGPGNN